MRTFKYTAIAFIATLFIVSCEKEIPYKGKNRTPLLVLNSITEGDSVIKVKLERSRFFLQPTSGSTAITTGAELTLTNQTNGMVYTVNTVDAEGNYVFPVTAVQGHSYKISVTHPDYKTITSVMTVPVVIPILSVDTIPQVLEFTEALKATIRWNDPVGEDFYALKVVTVSDGQPLGDYLLLTCSDPSLDEVSVDNSGSASYSTLFPNLFFRDQLFDGKEKSMEVTFLKSYLPPQGVEYHYKFILYRCTENTYKYLVSVKKNTGQDPFSEPAKVFSNIENGYGIFSALSGGAFVK